MPDKHQVRKGSDIIFADGISRTVYPLTIKILRKFVPLLDKINHLNESNLMTNEDIDVMVQAAQLILEKVDKNLAVDKEATEDAVDVVVFRELMDAAMGASSPNV